MQSADAADCHAFIYVFDNEYVVCKALEEVMGRRGRYEAFIHNQTVLRVIANSSNKVKQRSQIGGCALEQLNRRGASTQIR